MSRIVRLGDIAKIYSGGTPSRYNPAYWGGDIPWVKTTQIQNCHISEDDIDEWITKEGMKNSSAKPVPRGSILMAMIGQGKTRGQVAILDVDATTNQNAAAIQLDSQHDRDYVFQQLLFRYKHIRNVSNASGQQNLNLEIIRSITFPSPPLPEQTAIADLLSTWDEAIEKTERLIQAKERRFKAIVQRLVGQKCREWPHVRPSELFDAISEKNYPEEELLSVTQDRGVIPRSMLEGRVMSPQGNTDSYKLIRKGDFAISLRSFQGGIEYSEYQGIISPAYTVLRPKKLIDPDFYKLFFKTYLFIEKYLSIAVIGIRDGKQISIPDFMNIRIPAPPLDEQKRIAEALSTAQQEIDLLSKLVERYKKQKRGLMQKLLTGQWRVRMDKEVA
ncbi:MAG TPA: restriction endonuclease subunit S [Gammaproteobacteria bacterium]|nr:restriction endonuclease subunit S [Gammaproteobacteria bacterium]